MAAANSKQPMILIILVFLAGPLIAIYYVYINPDAAKARGFILKGNLVEKPVRLKLTGLLDYETKKQVSQDMFEHKHTYVYITGSRCGDICQRNIYIQRQVHNGQDRKRDRVRRIIILTDTDAIAEFKQKVMIKYPLVDLYVVKPEQQAQFISQFRVKADEDVVKQQRIYLVSPLGDVWLYYPPDINYKTDGAKLPGIMFKDLKKILKSSVRG